MQPIGSQSCLKNPGNHLDAAAVNSAGGRVLPRLLRKPMRFLAHITPSRLLASGAARAVLILGLGLPAAGILVSQNDSASGFVAAASSQAGFTVRHLVINGGQSLDRQALRFLLGSELEKSLFEFDVEVARERIRRNSWVADVTVRKIYPNTVAIDIVEREPYALWQAGGAMNLIANDGAVIGEVGSDHPILPQVVGEGANMAAHELLSTIAEYPMIASRMSAYVRVADRRWNLISHEGTKILLPEAEWQSALSELYDLQANREILDRDLVQIDMRLADRLVVRMRPGAGQDRLERIETQIKNAEHKI